jgi:LysR family transcriptional regulator of gallate degradation
MAMHLRQIAHYIQTVEQGSIGKAARALNLTQPALSKSLQQLEHEMSAALLERSAQGVRTTVLGQSFYEHAKRIDTEFKNARYELEELRGVRKGSISVGAIPEVARRILPKSIAQLTRAHPGVTVSVSEMNNTELFVDFDKGTFDFVIGVLDQHRMAPGQISRILFHDELVVVVRPSHPLTRLSKVTPTDLLRFPWIYPNAGTARRERIDNFFFAEGLDPPEVTIEGSSTSFKLAILLESDLVTMMPEGVVMADGTARQLAVIKLGSKFLRRPVGIVHRGWKNLLPSSRTLIGEIRGICDKGDTAFTL